MRRLLIIGYVWPEPASSAAGSRMMQLIEFFRLKNYQITFATTARETENKIDLKEFGVVTETIKLNDPTFDDFIEALDPEIVLFDRFMMEEQFGWRVDLICPDAIKILDTEDLHFLRNARHQAFKENCDVTEIYQKSDLAKREIAAIYRCDLSLIISKPEMVLLETSFKVPNNILCYVPFMLDEISRKQQLNLPEYKNRKDLISIGNFLHEPNWNAVLHLKEKIWPQLRRRLPGVKLNIYGAYVPQKALNLHNETENFLVHGWTKDSDQVMKNSRLCLAPIQFGAGLKGKLVEAMKNGTPSITTPVGAEGITDSNRWNGYIANSDEEFIQKTADLYKNKKSWEEKQSIGFEIYKDRFHKGFHQERLWNRLSEIRENLSGHRDLNFTGKMLKHHLHKSTYYMSRYIEEKNRYKN